MLVEQIDKPLFIMDGDTGFLGLGELRASIFADDEIDEFLTDLYAMRRSNLA